MIASFFLTAAACHRLAENLRIQRMVGEVSKPRHAEDVLECRLAGFDAVEDFTPGAPVLLLA